MGRERKKACEVIGKTIGDQTCDLVIDDVLHSYPDWTGDVFRDYQVRILRGTRKQVKRFIETYLLNCDDCNGCGDW